MSQCQVNGIQLEYETLGDPAAPAVLLIMGLGAQLTRWPERFCQGLVDGGFRVIRYDNRDVGLSSKMSSRVTGRRSPRLVSVIVRSALGLPVRLAYTLDDMAADAVGLLDALSVRRAHVIGVSMGGMIGQILVARHPDRVDRFVSIMSTSGSRSLPEPSVRLRMMLTRSIPQEREARIRRTMEVLRLIGSKTHPPDETMLRAQVTRDLNRCDDQSGYRRQLSAIIASHRLDLLPLIKAPTLIIHGVEDPLVPVAAAYDLQRRIDSPEAKTALSIIPGMGHDLPALLLPQITERIVEHLRAS